jgi:hypothetical protein
VDMVRTEAPADWRKPPETANPLHLQLLHQGSTLLIVIETKSGTSKIKVTIRLPLSFKTNDLIRNWKVLERRKILHLYMKTDMIGRGKIKHPVGYTRWMLYSFGFMITFSDSFPSITN